MDYQVLSTHRGRKFILKKNSIWYYKHVADKILVYKKIQKKLASDILDLYKSAQFADLKLKAFGGFIYCHQHILISRYPSIWHFLSKIEKTQHFNSGRTNKLIEIDLISIKYCNLEPFIRSLYTHNIDEQLATHVVSCLEKQLWSLQQCLEKKKPKKVFIEKLNCTEEKLIQQLLLAKFKKGEISESKGNLHILTSIASHPLRNRKRSQLPIPHIPTFNKFHGTTVISSNCDGESDSNILRNQTKNFVEEYPAIRYSSMNCDDAKNECTDAAFKSRGTSSNSLEECNYSQSDKNKNMEVLKLVGSTNTWVKKSTNQNETNKSTTNSDCDRNNEISPTSDNEVSDNSDQQAALHETSSLEVELPSSSQDDQSFSAESGPSDECSTLISTEKLVESKPSGVDPRERHRKVADDRTFKPLVRTRTFDLIEPTCASKVPVVQKQDAEASTNDIPAKNYISSPEDQQPTSPQDVKPVVNFGEQDQQNLKELERLKGSLLFEHNLQTFSNIPSTNMMNLHPEVDDMNNCSRFDHSTILSTSVPPSVSYMTANENTAYHLSSDMITSPILIQDEVPLSCHPPLLPQISRDEALELHHEIIKRGPGSRSPSPDSLGMDLSPRDPPVPHLPQKNKEDSHYEEKELDEKNDYHEENSVFSSSLIAAYQEKKKVNRKSSSEFHAYEDDIPIVSGGLTLQKSNDTNVKQQPHPIELNRQISSGTVKDIDSIPVISGYNALAEDYEDQQKTDAKQSTNDEDSKNQSMFSMFINLDEIPSPEKEAPKIDQNKNKGTFMFIESDSPKVKRRPRLNSRGSKELSVTKVLSQSASPKCNETSSSKTPPKDQEVSAKTTSSSIIEKSLKPLEKCKETAKDNIEEKPDEKNDKKGFFVFIEAGAKSKTGSPKPRRRPPVRNHSKGPANVMSRSAPSDTLLFKKDDSSIKLSIPESANHKFMTKSVIDRDEFISQTPAKRNVSLKDNINESSKIPRPIKDFKEKILASQRDLEVMQKLKKYASKSSKIANEEKKKQKVAEPTSTKSLETSTTSDAVTSLSSSINELLMIPPDIEDASEISDVGSLLSSLERSNEKSSVEGGKVVRAALGDDLLKMFLNEINTDVTIQIGEKKIRAHKCILASRCVYFAAMLSGHWVESAGNIIKLQGFSYDVVMEALKHIYSGSGSIPEGIKVSELAAISDMLALDGLKEVVALHYKTNLCHYFHKPCPDCIDGVMQVLPIAGAYCIDDLYHKCLRWISKNFEIVLPTKNFSRLPVELQDRCLKQIMDDMCVNNVIDDALGADRVLSLLPSNARWAEHCLDLAAQLLESVTSFIASHFDAVVASQRFLSLGKSDSGWNVDNLEDILKMSCDLLRPDQAVLTHIQLSNLTELEQRDSDTEYSEVFVDMCDRILNLVEKFLIHNANRVSVCRQWPLLAPSSQKRIKDAAMIVLEFSKPPKASNTQTNNRTSRGASLEPITRVRASSMTDHRIGRSSSSTTVPSAGKATALLPGRKLQTPPPTRASTLRAQARQTAIQRSHSARTIADNRPKKLQPVGGLNAGFSDNEEFLSSNATPTTSGSNRPSNITRTVSRTDEKYSKSKNLTTYQPGISSRSSTPVIFDKVATHKRNGSYTKSFTTDEELHPKCNRNSVRPLSSDENSVSSKFIRTHSSDVHAGTSTDINKKPLDGKASRGKNVLVPAMGRRTRSPLRENNPHRYPSSTSTLVKNSNPSHHLRHSPSSEESTCTNSSSHHPPPVVRVGLGSRSNTFCLDNPRQINNTQQSDSSPANENILLNH